MQNDVGNTAFPIIRVNRQNNNWKKTNKSYVENAIANSGCADISQLQNDVGNIQVDIEIINSNLADINSNVYMKNQDVKN